MIDYLWDIMKIRDRHAHLALYKNATGANDDAQRLFCSLYKLVSVSQVSFYRLWFRCATFSSRTVTVKYKYGVLLVR